MSRSAVAASLLVLAAVSPQVAFANSPSTRSLSPASTSAPPASTLPVVSSTSTPTRLRTGSPALTADPTVVVKTGSPWYAGLLAALVWPAALLVVFGLLLWTRRGRFIGRQL